MTGTNSTRWDPRAASLLLVSSMCLLPFLLPRHFPPLRTFYDEWIAFALGTGAIGIAALAQRSRGVVIPPISAWMGAFAVFLCARAFSGLPAYPQGSLLWATYIMFAALLVILGHELAAHFGRERVCDMLASFLLLGAMLNSASGVLQVVGIPRQVDTFFAYLSGTRAIGNIGQANLYANYLAVGAASLAYLFSRGKIGRKSGLAAGFLLLTGAALAASRSSALYSALFAVLGYVAKRNTRNAAGMRIGMVAITLAMAGVLMQWIIPILLRAVGFSIEGSFNRDSVEWESGKDDSTHLRMLGWQLAWRLFATSPWFGVGPGEFAGAGFIYGLPLELAANELWTSPHNLVLQLLSETGLAGAAMVGFGVWTWMRRAIAQYFHAPTPDGWWLLSCAGVEGVHALLEYPFWYANFLALTALLLGVGSSGTFVVRPLPARTALASVALIGAILLGVNLRDYFRFELASPAYAGRSLASNADLQRDLDVLARLNRGLLAPRAELFLFLSVPVDADGLAEKIEIGNRVMRTWPLREVVFRQCIFLALAGRDVEAQSLLRQARITFTNRAKAIRELVHSAPEKARKVLEPALLDPQ